MVLDAITDYVGPNDWVAAESAPIGDGCSVAFAMIRLAPVRHKTLGAI